MSSSDQKRLRRSLNRAQKAADKLGMSDRRARKSTATAAAIRRQFGINIVSLAVIVGVIWAATAFLGVSVNLAGVAALFGLAVMLSLATNRTGSFSFGFAAISIGVVAVLTEYVIPSTIVGLFDPVVAWLALIPGVPALLSIPSLQLFALTVGVVMVYWVLDIRVLTAFYRQSEQPQAANADTVARALAGRVEGLFEDYVQVGVALGALAVTLTIILLSGVGDLGAQAFEAAGEVPVLAAGLFNWATGYLALGGTVPVLTDLPLVGGLFELVFGQLAGLDAIGYLLLAGVVLVLAWFAKEARD